MEYKLLKKIYYKDKHLYEKLYQQRINSVSCNMLNIMINGSGGFYVVDNEVLGLISDIYKLDKTLALILKDLPIDAIESYTRKSLLDEVRLTNEIEGVRSTRKELEFILNDLKNTKKKRFYGLVNKYFLLGNSDIQPVSCKDIRNIYNDLCLKDVVEDNPDNQPDGSLFRVHPVSITNGYKTVHMGVQSEAHIIDYMEKALAILNDNRHNELINISVFHYLFGYIHPFYDGNGRVDRFISSYMLSRCLNPLIGYRLSHTIKESVNSYYKAFEICNEKLNKGDVTPFVILFLEIIKKSLDDIIASLSDSREKMQHYYMLIERMADTERERTILKTLVCNELFGSDGLNMEQLATMCDIGETTVRKILARYSFLISSYKSGRKICYNIQLNKIE